MEILEELNLRNENKMEIENNNIKVIFVEVSKAVNRSLLPKGIDLSEEEFKALYDSIYKSIPWEEIQSFSENFVSNHVNYFIQNKLEKHFIELEEKDNMNSFNKMTINKKSVNLLREYLILKAWIETNELDEEEMISIEQKFEKGVRCFSGVQVNDNGFPLWDNYEPHKGLLNNFLGYYF